MALTNDQIERYSRQIIAPGFGGAAQQKLLSSGLLLVAGYTDAELILPYLVGAGVGQIDLLLDSLPPVSTALTVRMRDLNADVNARLIDEPRDTFDLALILAATAHEIDRAAALCFRPENFATVFARLDSPAVLAVFPSRPPCPRCALGGVLLAPPRRRGDEGDFVAHLAATEALKLLAGYAPALAPTFAEFRGYGAEARQVTVVPDAQSACRCASAVSRLLK